MDRLFQGRHLQRCGHFKCHFDIHCQLSLSSWTSPSHLQEYIVSVNCHIWNVPKTPFFNNCSFFCHHSYNRMPQMGSSHSRHFFLMVLEADNPRLKCWQAWFLLSLLFSLPLSLPSCLHPRSGKWPPLTISPWMCILVHKFRCIGIILDFNLSLQRPWCQTLSQSSVCW